MAQDQSELSSMYLETGEPDLGPVQQYNGTLCGEVHPTTTLTTLSGAAEKYFRTTPESSGDKNVIIQIDVPPLQTDDSAVPHEQNTSSTDPGMVQLDQEKEDNSKSQQQRSATVKKKRVTYDYIPADLKRKIVDYATKHGTRPAAQLFDINEPTIRYWKQKGFAISRGRKVTYGKDLDREIYAGLLLLKSNGETLTVDQFTDYAKKLIDERRPELNFKCSRGWLEKFFKRHNLEVVKSPSGKVMNIVESKKDSDFTLNENAMEAEEEEDENDGYEDAEINRSNEDPISNTENLVEQTLMEDSGPPAKRMCLTMDASIEPVSMTPPTSTATPTVNLQEIEVQRAKMQHIHEILKKLSGNVPPLTSYQKYEVVEHAKQNGSRSAERKFGVPETTIRYWVKKSLSSPQVQPISVPLPCISTVPSIAMNNISGHYSDSMNATPPSTMPLGAFQLNPESSFSSNMGRVNTDSPGKLTREDKVAACRMLHWATDQMLQDVRVGFDELCDRSLAHISQSNPGSAYSSTRKWVTQVLNLKIRDLLGIQE